MPDGIQRALISVSNKDGIVEFAQALREHGVELISSGGTAALLSEAGLEVRKVADVTGFPEMLDGRVKTLHPRIFAGVLARGTDEHQAQLTQHELPAIDLVVVNLYPFEQTVAKEGAMAAEVIEQIDIGGPSLLRAAAKNNERVTVLCDPAQYAGFLSAWTGGTLDGAARLQYAADAFAHTAGYDAAINRYFQSELQEGMPDVLSIHGRKLQSLRYGENPHQQAAFYQYAGAAQVEPPAFEQLQGKELSYNNLVDADAAWRMTCELPEGAVCVVKHTNPCGAAVSSSGNLSEAFQRALAGDPVSAFGGIVACNKPVDEATASALREIFLEVVIAPDFSEEALTILRRKKKLRLVKAVFEHPRWEVRAALGGLLLQSPDKQLEQVGDAKVVTERKLDAAASDDMAFAWAVCKHVKSNAIVLVKDMQLIGVGAGQMSRVDSVKLAVSRARVDTKGAVLASDAFFPFRDGLDEAAKAGVSAVIQPGGSVRDEEVIAAADEHGMAMALTGVRHFKH